MVVIQYEVLLWLIHNLIVVSATAETIEPDRTINKTMDDRSDHNSTTMRDESSNNSGIPHSNSETEVIMTTPNISNLRETTVTNPRVNFGLVIPIPTFNISNKFVTLIEPQLPYELLYGNKTIAMPTYKYVLPTTAGICLVATVILASVLIKRIRTGSSMSRASYFLLISIASADSLTLLFAITEVVFLYVEIQGNENILPFDSCNTMLILERLSAIPHAASTWFTVLLAIQRYVCVAVPFAAERYININKSIISVIVVSLFNIILHACRFFDRKFAKTSLRSMTMPGTRIETCLSVHQSWILDPVFYESMFSWLRIVVTQLIPCLLIVCFVYLMLKSLKNMNVATKQMHVARTQRQLERRQLNIFVIVTSSVVFCIEATNAIFLSFNTSALSTGNNIFSYETLKAASLGFDVVLYLSYFLIFFIYCIMSHDFRHMFVSCWNMIVRTSEMPSGETQLASCR